MATPADDKTYGDNEAEVRFQRLLKAAVNTPPTPLKSMTPKGTPSQSKDPDRRAKEGVRAPRKGNQ
jgi:hypothetical protein